jgi:hypothetical protein
VLTSFDFLAPGALWPPESERARLRQYDANKKLFDGDHNLVLKDWQRLLREDQKSDIEMILNWYKRLSVLWADLLLGEPPRFNVEEDGRETLDDILEQNNLLHVAYEVALDISRYGTGIFKTRWDERSYIEAIPATIWFPVVEPDNIKRIQAHVLGWEYSRFVPSLFGTYKEHKYLKVEKHERGVVTTQEYALKDSRIGQLLSENIVHTGIDEFLVVPVHNLTTSDSPYGYDDYKDLSTILSEIAVRFAQIARILDKHSDPNMYGPDSAMELDPETGQYVFRGGGKYFPVADGETPPGYVVWNGELNHAYKEIEMLLEQLYHVSETTPAAFGNMKQGTPESGSALKRLLLAPLAHVNRIRMQFDPGLKRVIKLANQLDISYGGSEASELGRINIQWQDGLPKDDKEVTDIEVSKFVAGLSSLEMSVAKLEGVEGEALQLLVEAIKKEKEEKEQRMHNREVEKMEKQAQLKPPGASATPQAVLGGAKTTTPKK